MSAYIPSSRRFGSIMIRRTSSGVARYRMLVSIAFSGHGFAGPGCAGDQQVGHGGQVGHDRLAVDGLAERQRELRGRLGIRLRLQQLPQRDLIAHGVGNLHADGRLAGDALDEHGLGLHCQAEIVRQAGDPAVLHAGVRLELEGRDNRTGVDLDHRTFHRELAAFLFEQMRAVHQLALVEGLHRLRRVEQRHRGTRVAAPPFLHRQVGGQGQTGFDSLRRRRDGGRRRGADKAGGGGSRSTFPAGSPGAEAGSGVFVFSLVFVFGRAGSFRRERSGPRLRARTSVRAEDAPVLARCLFTTSRRCRSRCRLVHQPLTVVRIARSVARRPRQTAEKSWPSGELRRQHYRQEHHGQDDDDRADAVEVLGEEGGQERAKVAAGVDWARRFRDVPESETEKTRAAADDHAQAEELRVRGADRPAPEGVPSQHGHLHGNEERGQADQLIGDLRQKSADAADHVHGRRRTIRIEEPDGVGGVVRRQGNQPRRGP